MNREGFRGTETTATRKGARSFRRAGLQAVHDSSESRKEEAEETNPAAPCSAFSAPAYR
jgi:hypothetical protein